MGGKKDMMKIEKEQNSPGPGAYMPDDTKLKKKGPQFGFGTEKKMREFNRSKNPDPSSYNVNDNLMHKTTSSWGMGYGQKIDLAKTLTDTPGPGSYNYASTITEGKKYGMGGRTDMFKNNGRDDSPGPGQYSPSIDKSKKSAPKFGFGTDSRLKEAGKRQMPDPGSYNIKDDLMHKTSSSWGMGYGSKVDFNKMSENNPGPGSYEMKSTITDGKKYGIGNKTDMFKINQDDGPGPGSYKSEVIDLKKQHKSYRWSKGNRFDLKNGIDTPGPGLYKPKTDFGGPKYGFGSDSRDKKSHDDMPGPGHYDHKGLLNNIKEYESNLVSKLNAK